MGRKRLSSPIRFRLTDSDYPATTSSSGRSVQFSLSQHRRHRARYLQLLMDGLSWLTNKRTRGAQMSTSKSSIGSQNPPPVTSSVIQNKSRNASSKQKPGNKRGRKPKRSKSKGRRSRKPTKGKSSRGGRGGRGRPATRRSARQSAKRGQERGGRRAAPSKGRAAPSKGKTACKGRGGRKATKRQPAPARTPKAPSAAQGIKQRLRGYRRSVRRDY